MTAEEKERLINEQYEIIMQNENLLNDEDYKVIKCAEAKVQDREMPYDTVELIARRNGYRKAINDAQERIRELEEIEPEAVETE